MKKTIIGLALLFMTSGAYATGFSLAVDKQDVAVVDPIPAGTNSIGTVAIDTALPAGTNNIGDVDVLSLPAIPTGTNAIGSIQLIDSGANELDVNVDGSIDVNATVTGTADVTGSTITMQGANGQAIESTATAQGEAILSHDTSQPITAGLAMVMSSDDAVLVADATQVCTGLAKNVTLMAYGGACTFTLWDASSMQITKNTGESFDLEFLVTNASIDLTAKDASATCKARITCAQ